MKTATVVLTGGALLLASASLAQERGELKAIYEGRALYVAHCAGCHGLDARGTAWGTDGHGGCPDLTRIAARDGRFRIVHVGNHIGGRHDGDSSHRSMPIWLRQLKQEWPAGDAVAPLKVAWMAQYLGAIQRSEPATR